MRLQLAFAVIPLALLALAGCNDTAKGMEKDSKDNAKAVETSSHNAADAFGEAGDAMKLTPQVKNAILANPMLNEDGNLIDVDTDGDHLYLKGHVKTAAMKDDAGQIAKKILTENKAKQTLKNDLLIK